MNTDSLNHASLYWIGKLQCPPAIIASETHAHDFNEMILVLEGKYEAEIQGHPEVLNPGDYIIYPMQIKHLPIHRPDFSKFYVLQWNMADLPLDNYLIGRDDQHKLSVLMHWIYSSFPSDQSQHIALHETLLRAILQFCFLETPVSNDPIDQVEHYLKNISHAEVSMQELAEYVNLSTRHLTRLFRERYQLTPRQYLINLRLDKALHLVISSSYSFKDIASLSGFTSTQHFYRSFKQRYKLSPNQYRHDQQS